MGADGGDGRAEPLEHGTHPLDRIRLTADEDEQIALAGTHRSAGQRRVDERDPALGQRGRRLAHRADTDGAGQQHDGTLAEPRRDARLAEQRVVQLLPVAHGEQHDVRIRDGVPRRLVHDQSLAAAERTPFGARVEPADGLRLGEAQRHRQPHRAETEHGDGDRFGHGRAS